MRKEALFSVRRRFLSCGGAPFAVICRENCHFAHPSPVPRFLEVKPAWRRVNVSLRRPAAWRHRWPGGNFFGCGDLLPTEREETEIFGKPYRKEGKGMKITKQKFGEVGHEPVYAYTLENDRGMRLTCLNLGCTVTEILAPDRDGNLENVVLGFDRVEDYLRRKTYFGAIIGRIAGRIRGAEFALDGKTYTLPANEGNNHLHGGIRGFHERIWEAKPVEEKDAVGVEFTYLSKDGEEGYPGNLQVRAVYWLTNENRWIQKITAKTDKKTIVNLTNHSYFNLSGNGKDLILDHELTLKSDRFLELDEELLPTGKKLEVEGTPFDFRKGRKIFDGTVSRHPQNLLAGNGYDHPFLLSENLNQEIVLRHRESGRKLTVETNQPCVVVYTSNALGEDFAIQGGVPSRKYLGICLETQGLPDAVHHSDFPPVVLEPDGRYEALTTYTFSTE